MRLPVEVLPDLTKPTVIILTEASGLAPEEVETRVTQPIENALMGVSGLTRLRSNSDVALSLVYAEFGWDTDIYKARVLVQERLQAAREQLPEDVQPFMTPVASLMEKSYWSACARRSKKEILDISLLATFGHSRIGRSAAASRASPALPKFSTWVAA